MSQITVRRVFTFAAVVLAALAVSPPAASAQLGGLGGALKKVGNKLPDPTAALQRDPPITTSLSDARWAVDSLDNFMPRDPQKSLMTLQRTANGGFVLQPGFYTLHAQSYCLKAGTHGPGGGDGYLYAPTDGPADNAVMSIVRNSSMHPEIDQHDIQVLLWAIIARSKFDDLPNGMKLTAARLLTPQQLLNLNRSALDLIPESALNAALAKLPAAVRTVIEAEAKLRKMLIDPSTTFAELERVAVLAGMAPLGEGSLKVPPGRWSLHPDGYYVKYNPYGYTNTEVFIWVPQGSAAVGKEYDPATHIAVPGNTARQRLIQSARAYRQT